MTEPALLRADARALPLPDASVDLIVTSPPYFGLRSYQDGGKHYDGQIGAEATPTEFVDALIDCTREMMRVLKPSGSLFVDLGDRYSQRPGQHPQGNVRAGAGLGGGARSDKHIKARTGRGYSEMQPKSLVGIPWRYAIQCIDELGLTLRAEIVWAKSNGMPESATDRVRRSHETWFHLTKEPQYFEAVDAIRDPPSGYARPNGTGRDARGGQKARKMLDTVNPLGRVPGSVWEIATQPLKVPDRVAHARCCNGRMRPGCEDGVDHFAAFPMEWPRRLIKGWCPPGGVVLDPFGGTGTTALVASMLGRRGISVDLSADYGRLAQWRCSDPKERAKAAGTDPSKAAAAVPGQGDLFGDAA